MIQKTWYNVTRGLHKHDYMHKTRPPLQTGSFPTTQGHADDFRPTVPGHSPGVGHSVKTQLRLETACKDMLVGSLTPIMSHSCSFDLEDYVIIMC